MVYVRSRAENGATVFWIDVEEWLGGEGYEDEELRTTSPDELIDAIPK